MTSKLKEIEIIDAVFYEKEGHNGVFDREEILIKIDSIQINSFLNDLSEVWMFSERYINQLIRLKSNLSLISRHLITHLQLPQRTLDFAQ